MLFQTIGGLIGVGFALGGTLLGVHLFGRYGVLSLAVVVPLAVIGGWLIIKILHFAKRILSE